MGHEAIGVVTALHASHRSHLRVGSLVFISPHFIPEDDPLWKLGSPNLSDRMKHLGTWHDGAFRTTGDFPESILREIPFPQSVPFARDNRYLDAMVLLEPLATVMRPYRIHNLTKQTASRVLVIGGGSMGVLHAMYLCRSALYGKAIIDLYEPHPVRREVVREVLSQASYLGTRCQLVSAPLASAYALVVMASSSPAAVTSSLESVESGGTLLLFSGIDVPKGETVHHVWRGVDIEWIHRYEESVTIHIHHNPPAVPEWSKEVTFVGTYGYTLRQDIPRTIAELHADMIDGGGNSRYGLCVTSATDGFESATLDHRFNGLCSFGSPAFLHLLNNGDDADLQAPHLKVMARLNGDAPLAHMVAPMSQEEEIDEYSKAWHCEKDEVC